MDEPDLRVRIDHVGIAVEDRSTIEPVLHALGGTKIADEPADGYRWIQYDIGGLSRLELIEPTEEGTFLTKFLESNGPGLHHVTFEVASLTDIVAHLTDVGVAVVDEATRHRYREAFVPPSATGGVLFQLMEFESGYTDAYGEPGVGNDLLHDRAYMD